MSAADIYTWLKDTPIAEAVRGTPYLYPSLEAIHIIGIALLIGPAMAFDLRLLGVGRPNTDRDHRRRLPATTLAHRVRGGRRHRRGDVHPRRQPHRRPRQRAVEARAPAHRRTEHPALPPPHLPERRHMEHRPGRHRSPPASPPSSPSPPGPASHSPAGFSHTRDALDPARQGLATDQGPPRSAEVSLTDEGTPISIWARTDAAHAAKRRTYEGLARASASWS